MKINYAFFACAVLLIYSCKQSSKSNHHRTVRNESSDINYKIHFNPPSGSTYYYDVVNESETKMEVGEQKLHNFNTITIGAYYDINKDSADNILLHTRYDKINLHSKNGDNETDLDAANAAHTNDPVERMLGILKEANITATLSPTGAMKAMGGYQELTDKIIASLNMSDINTRNYAKNQWNKVIGEGMIKNNMEQLFSLFPDSAVQVGDTWKLTTKQKGEISLNIISTYTLKSIDDGIAVIESEGEITGDKSALTISGYDVEGDLSGEQEGEYHVDTKTGMLTRSNITAKITGTLQIMGRKIPVRIKTKVTLTGRKVK